VQYSISTNWAVRSEFVQETVAANQKTREVNSKTGAIEYVCRRMPSLEILHYYIKQLHIMMSSIIQ
jgi:hypothetical protein